MTVDPRRCAAALEALLPETLALLEAVVNIDSGSYDAPGVNAVLDMLGAALARPGFAIARRPVPGRGDQLTAHRRWGSGPSLVILGHADTVWPAGTVAQWPFARVGDRLTGPGIGDMKGGIVMAIAALRVLAEQEVAGLGQCRFLLVPDEELGSPQSRVWIEAELAGADACLTLEPGRPDGSIVTGRGAVGALYIAAEGASAHCAVAPEQGASAVRALARLIEPLEALSRPERGIGVSVGIFRGGAARQVVPPEAELHVDLRAPDATAADRLLAAVEALVAQPPADPRIRLSLRGGITRPAFPRGPGTRALYALAQQICSELKVPIGEVISRGGSDGSFAAALGVPTLDGLGPICHASCSRRETIEPASLVHRGALLAGLIGGIAEGRFISGRSADLAPAPRSR